jgi:hypothetical protein
VRSLATQIFIRIKEAYTNLSNPKKLEEYRATRAPRVPEAAEQAPPEEAAATPPTDSPTSQPVATPSFDSPTPTPAATPVSRPSQRAAAPPPESKQPQPASTPPPESRRRPKKRPKPSPLAKKFMRTVLEQTSQRGPGTPRSARPDRTPTPSSEPRAKRPAKKKKADSVVAKDPSMVEADARVSEALALVASKRHGEAIEVLRSALEFAPGHAKAKVLLPLCEARYLASKGKQDAAVAKYEAVLELDPGHAEARQELHEVKQASGPDKKRGLFSRILTRED